MMSLVTPAEWGIFYIGLGVCVVVGVVAGVVNVLWSSRKKRDD